MRFKWERCTSYKGEINLSLTTGPHKIIGWIETRKHGFTPIVRGWEGPSELEAIEYPTVRAAMRALRNEYAVYLMQPKEDDDETERG